MSRWLVLLLSLATACSGSGKLAPNTFRVAFLSDTHLIDSYYVGPENSPLDTESILHSEERLRRTQQYVNAVRPPVEQVFISGDIIHDYGSTDRAFYDQHRTVFDIGHEIFGGFTAPVHVGYGNHDYDLPRIPKALTEDLFKTKLGAPSAYYVVEYKGWKFVHLNCFQGEIWDPASPKWGSDSEYGSFGRAQLEWLDTQLADGKPAVLMFHIPIPFIQPNEFPDLDFASVVSHHPDAVKLIIAGHWHMWLDLTGAGAAPHKLISSTRYDEHAFAVADFSTDTQEIVWVHPELQHQQDYKTDPWPQ
jgi:hypothetical protein